MSVLLCAAVGKAAFLSTRSQRARSLAFPSLAFRLSFSFDTLAATPGKFTAPASRAWVYYTPEHKHWVAAPLVVAIDPIGGATFEDAFAEARALESTATVPPAAKVNGAKKWYEHNKA